MLAATSRGEPGGANCYECGERWTGGGLGEECQGKANGVSRGESKKGTERRRGGTDARAAQLRGKAAV